MSRNPISELIKDERRGLSAIKEYAKTHSHWLMFPDSTGRTPLHHAAIRGDMRIVQSLVIWGANVNVSDFHGRSPLHLAIQFGNYGLVEFLLENHAMASARDCQNKTPLHFLMQNKFEGWEKIAGLLIANGASLKDRDCLGLTPQDFANSVAVMNF